MKAVSMVLVQPSLRWIIRVPSYVSLKAHKANPTQFLPKIHPFAIPYLLKRYSDT
ncbi:hypothetical protein Ab1vBOLIVR2_gp42 [Agrobacterium phage OLIVR2]|uniref:Uncharacterized protein n=1 Tax=Agrobacterium phage OLIVR1 TaxID=2723769 RepID=A0A858MR33_9CAUD|nr:hypothetical protein KNU98_gp067 [Agrobacterium phage OLIVR1]QIW87237.1 hypothetical protein Ab1vBOLIVR1_gp42 [Agrobacterium phage OLIVR1]QIW87345.1 hypothetical protein Ab1vBOLIVR2_gp42 [Agrobacterium phage OLIVR2]QIW87452.1 hypothetical protein Ab1vBOLIVR3_gp42 [Agrobacterium phage OLIVR3]